MAAQLEGAPILTLDLDVLYDKTAENIDRLLAALRELKARYRDPAGRQIEPDKSKLETMRQHLFLTELGALDVLAAIGNGLTYPDLAGRTVTYELGEMRVRVLELAAVIETKEQAKPREGPRRFAGLETDACHERPAGIRPEPLRGDTYPSQRE